MAPRREIFAFPFVYLSAALALEYLRLALTRGRWRLPAWLFYLACILTSVWLGTAMVKRYEAAALAPGFRQFCNTLLMTPPWK